MSVENVPIQVVKKYFEHGYRVVFWEDEGSRKGPKEPSWQVKEFKLEDYNPKKHRVGLITGVEVEPGKFLLDVDIDWAEGSKIAQKILPNTDFVFGRSSKLVSHCFYTTSEPLQSYKFEDIDGTALLEIRGVKRDGTLGFQTMVPPSTWEHKENPEQREPLQFRRSGLPAHLESSILRQKVILAAISMLLAKHLGQNGFGHEPRLAWAGLFLRLGFSLDDCQAMGEAISIYCNNIEVHDIRTVLSSTQKRLENPKARTKGGPQFAKYLGDQGKAVINRIHEWLGRDTDFIRDKNGLVVKDSKENIQRAIELLDFKLSYNEFSDKLLITHPNQQVTPLEDRQLNYLWLRIEEEFQFRSSYDFFDKVIRFLCWENSFHPVKQYLDSLTWDGVSRIDTWLETYAGASAETIEDNDYLHAVSSLVLIAAVRRIRTPGCKFDEMLVLESPQGKEKSTAIRALCPYPEWFSDEMDLNWSSQRLIEGTLGKWLIEVSDLSGKRKADIDVLKAMMSRQVDGPARMAYARLPIERPRHFLYIGTTNNSKYLNDQTGNRRFWPVKINKFSVAAIIRDRDQLWAEASVREAAGASIRLPEKLWKVAGEHQEERREVDAWEDAVLEIIENAPRSADGRKRFPTSAVWDLLGVTIDRRDRYGSLRISEILTRHGFEGCKMWHEGKTVVGYVSRDSRLGLEMVEENGKNGKDG